jgi:hypothetical protein
MNPQLLAALKRLRLSGMASTIEVRLQEARTNQLCRVGRWRTGTADLPKITQVVFPAAPLRTVHAVLPHTALPRIFTCPRRELPPSARQSLGRSTVAVATSVSPKGTHQRRSLPRMMRLQAFPRLRFCCPKATIGTMPAPTPSRVAVFALPERVSPVPCSPLSAFHAPYAGGFMAGASQIFPASMAFAHEGQARLPLVLPLPRKGV